LALSPPTTSNRSPAKVSREDAAKEGFIREVDEALRKDQALALARRYAMMVGFAVVAALALFAAYLGWSRHRESLREARAEQFIAALDQLEAGNTAAASKLLEPLGKDGGGGSQAAARMLQAGVMTGQGQIDGAANLLGQVAADDSAPQPFRDLAKLRQISLRFDKMKPDEAIAALKPLAVPGKPWYGSAGEMLGIAYLKQGKTDLAGPLFAAISRDKAVPDSIRGRTRQMAGQLGVDAIDDVNEAAANPGGAAAQPNQ